MSSYKAWVDQCLDRRLATLISVKRLSLNADDFHLGCYNVVIYACLEGFIKDFLTSLFRDLRRSKRKARDFTPEFVSWRAPEFDNRLKRCVTVQEWDSASAAILELMSRPLNFQGLDIKRELNQVNAREIVRIARVLGWETNEISDSLAVINQLVVDRNEMSHRVKTTNLGLEEYRRVTLSRIIAVEHIIYHFAILTCS